MQTAVINSVDTEVWGLITCHAHTLTLSHTHSLSLAHIHSLSHTHTHTLTHSHTHSLSDYPCVQTAVINSVDTMVGCLRDGCLDPTP